MTPSVPEARVTLEPTAARPADAAGGTTLGPRRRASSGTASVALGVLATVVVLVGAWIPSPWVDEAATASGASRSLADLWRLLGNVDAVHGVYYALMHAWVSFAGTSGIALRFPSAVLVGLAAAGLHRWAVPLVGGRRAVLAAAVFAVLPRVTWMGIEARSTALTTAALVWAAVASSALTRRARGSAWLWVATTAALAVACCTNVMVLLALPALALPVWSVAANRRRALEWSTAAFAAALLAAPVLLAGRSQSGQLGGVRLGPLQTMRSVAVNQWFLGATPNLNGDGGGGGSSLSAQTWWWVLPALGLAAVGWALVGRALANSFRTTGGREVLVWTLPWLVLPTLGVIAWTWVVSPVYHPRYLAFCAPPLALLIASGIAALRTRLVQGIAVGIVALLALPVVVSQRGPTSKNGYDWDDVAAFVSASEAPGQAVYYVPRDPPQGAVVHKDFRIIAALYPDVFTSMRDVTVLRSPVADASLYGTARPLADSIGHLRGTTGIWVLGWDDYPDGAVARDAAVLVAAGYTPGPSWHGRRSTAVLYLPAS